MYHTPHHTRGLMSKSNDNIFERRNEFNRPSPRRVSEYSINHGNMYSHPPVPLVDPGGISRSLSRDRYPHRTDSYRMDMRNENSSNTVIEWNNNISRVPFDPNTSSGNIQSEMYITRQPNGNETYVNRQPNGNETYVTRQPNGNETYVNRQPNGNEYVYTDQFGPDPTNYGCCSEMWCLTKYGPECLPVRASAVSLFDTLKPYMKYMFLLFVGQISTLIIVALSKNKSDEAASSP
jgi:hypothetical protein